MINILKAELKKFLQGKLFIATIFLLIIFPLMSGFMYSIMAKISDDNILLITPGSSFVLTFNPLNNFGVIFLIFTLIILLADFSQSTVRNKSIAGYSRDTIYLSSTIFTLIISAIVISLNAVFTYLITSVFVGFQKETFNLFEIWIVLIFATMALYSFVQFIANTFKSLGASLGIVLGTLFLVFLIYTIGSINISPASNQQIIMALPVLQLTNMIIPQGYDSVWMVLINLGYIIIIVLSGLFLNRRLDYK